jgi:HEPN domain-containing protein
MPDDLQDPTGASEWFRRARSNMARSRIGQDVPDVLYEDLCVDAHQATQKALKARVAVVRASPRNERDLSRHATVYRPPILSRVVT